MSGPRGWGLGSGTPAPVPLSPLGAQPDFPTGWARAQQTLPFGGLGLGGHGLEARETQRPPPEVLRPAPPSAPSTKF